MANQFAEIKVGDRVWIGNDYSKNAIETVAHRTPTLICTGAKGKDGRYYYSYRIAESRYEKGRFSARHIHGGSWNVSHVVRVATPEECATWDAEQEAERIADERRKQREKEAEALRQSLAGLFDVETTSVGAAQWGSRDEREGKFDVSFHGLTEKEVRDLASKLEATQ